MNKLSLRSILILLILNLGFVSCTKEKNQKSIQQDNFRVDAPILHAEFKDHDGINQKTLLLSSQIIEGILASSSLEFGSFKNVDFSNLQIRTSFESLCHSSVAAGLEPVPHKFKKDFTNIKSISLLNILDPILLVHAFQKQITLECSIVIEFTNQNGSTDKFTYPKLLVSPLAANAKKDFEIQANDDSNSPHDPSEPIVEESRSKSRAFSTVSHTKLSYLSTKAENVHLVCENFVAEMINPANTELQLAELIHSKLIELRDIVDAYKDVDPRVFQPKQICQIQIESGEAEKSLSFSQVFTIIYKVSSPIFLSAIRPNFFSKVVPGFSIFPSNSFEVFQVDVLNPINIPITLWIQSSTFGPEASALNRPGRWGNSGQLNIIVTGAKVANQNSRPGKVITIEPSGHAILSYQFTSLSGCESVVPRSPEPGYPHMEDYTAVWLRSSDVVLSQLPKVIMGSEEIDYESAHEFNSSDIQNLPSASWKSEAAANMTCNNFGPIN
jgi:hypothetical protein